MEEQDQRDREKLKKIAVGVAVFLVIFGILFFFQKKPPKQMTAEEVTARVAEIMETTKEETVKTDDGPVAQYVAENRDMLHIVRLEDGSIRYEYTCKKTQLIYVYCTDSPEDAAVTEMEVYDVEDYLHQQMPEE